jgi:hypothetical protein
MNGTAARFFRYSLSLAVLVFLGWVFSSQAAKPKRQGLPTDWTHSHVIFTKPASEEQARLISEDSRYWQQRYRREVPRDLNVESLGKATPEPVSTAARKRRGGLWAEFLGSGGTPGAFNYPAKYSFSSTTANCASASQPDYVVFSTGLIGSGTQASIVAFDNLYTGCGGSVPAVYWAYNTGGLILTSPVLSLDGTQIAFVQTSGSPTGNAGLVLLKWQASSSQTVGSPGVPNSVTAAQYPTCSAPCMTEVFLQDGSGGNLDDRTSSPYYDYARDTAWVGGTGGWLHKITGAFKGVPTEVTTGGFPKQVNGGNMLSNPVYDSISKNVFVGDLFSGGGFLYRVDSSTGAVTASGKLDHAIGTDPVLDATNGIIYAFASSDGSTSCTAGAACAAVYLLPTNFTAGSSGQKVTIGDSSASPNPVYLGAFDSAYINSSGANGNMYVCGNPGGPPTLYRIAIAGGVMTSPVPGATLTPAADSPGCSPVTDFVNANSGAKTTELLFVSTRTSGWPCAGQGCIMNYVSQPWQPLTQVSAGQEILVLQTFAYIQVALNNGTTGSTMPTWPSVFGTTTTDGSVTWVNQGGTSVTPLSAWTANNAYSFQDRVTDGANVEICVAAGQSGVAAPAWNPTIGGNTTDNGVTWVNAGTWPSSHLAVAGGTGGIIIDNASSSPGASQIYFFSVGSQTCPTSGGTGICAVQVSQGTLQ